ncbi:hypothetical protein [Modestobacter lapidis]
MPGSFTSTYRTRPTQRFETELYLGARRDPDLGALAKQWLDGFAAVLASHADPVTAAAVTALIDGATLQSVVTHNLPESDALGLGIKRLMPAGTAAVDGSRYATFEQSSGKGTLHGEC